MNILMVDYEYPPVGGGGGVFNKQIAEVLVKKHSITVITSGFANLEKQEMVNGVEIIRVPVAFRKNLNAASIISMLTFFPSSIFAGNALLKERRFDLVHSMFAIPSAPSGLYLAKKFRLPHFLSLLGGDVYDPSKSLSPHDTPLLKQIVRKMIHDSDKVIANSVDIKKRALQYYGGSENIDLISLGIIEPRFEAKKRSDFQLDENDILLVTVGRLVARKGLAHLLDIIKELNNKRVRLLIIGNGPESAGLMKQADDLEISDRIRFLGRVSDDEKFQILSLSDLYVSTSDHEGFGLVFLEAMATGLPVLCYDKGGQTDFLEDGKTGFLVPYGDRQRFVGHLAKLCGCRDMRREMGVYNSRHVRNFYIDRSAEHYDRLYRDFGPDKDNT
jgi:glycosyltransferase involved in cell wall biosynthesis